MASNQISLNGLNAEVWYAVEDEDLEGWCVSNSPTLFDENTRPDSIEVFAYTKNEAIARHIANVHNLSAGKVLQLSPDSLFSDGQLEEQYIVFCSKERWADIFKTFFSLEEAMKFYNALPKDSGRSLSKKYTWSRVDAISYAE